MNKLASILAAVVLLTYSGGASANLITNGQFEATSRVLGKQNSLYLDELDHGQWDVYSAIPGWKTFDGAGIEIQRNTVVAAHSLNNYVELDSHGQGSNSGMVQHVWLTEGLYDLSFWYRPRTNFNNDNDIEVLFGEQYIALEGVLTVGGIESQVNDWVQYKLQLHATSDSSWGIGFQAAGRETTYGGFIDDVTLTATPVPEPATMLLLGTGLVAVYGMRRKLSK